MSIERLVEVGVPPKLRQRAPAEFGNKLSEAVQRVWSDLHLPSRPRVAVTDHTSGSVAVDGWPVPVSARRVEQAILAGTGVARQLGEAGAPRELLIERLESPDVDDAAHLVPCLVDVALRGYAPALVRADSTVIAQQLIVASGLDASRLEVMSDAITCAAEHGVAPRPLANLSELVGDGDEGPDVLGERLVNGWLADAPPRPVIEASPTTLRRLTTGERILGNEDSLLDLMNELFLRYGVRPPPLSLRAADQPESVVRFRFGRSRTAAHLVLPETQAVLMIDPCTLPPESGARPFIDPVHGETWSLVDLPLDRTWSQEMVLDPAALVTRALLAEMKTRLALWSPTWDEIRAFDWPGFDRERLHLDEASGALRWLLSAQASVHLVSRLTEGVVTAAAEGVRGPAAIATRLRSFLGRAVLGPLAASSDNTLIEVDGPLARKAAESHLAAPLLDQHPALTTATSQFIVTSPSRWRREVECLLRPLSDSAVIAAEEEIDMLPVTAT